MFSRRARSERQRAPQSQATGLFGRLLPRRNEGPAPDRAITAFWQWWPTIRGRLTASIDAHEGGVSMVDEIGARVAAIHPDLHWELSKGSTAQHALIVSPGGLAALRAVAARWRAAAPPTDDVWEFHDGRQRSVAFDDFSLQIAGHTLEMGEVRFGVIATGDEPHVIDVTVHHPAFGDPTFDEQVRLQITYLALDWALGENGVEVWVGMVEPMATMPPKPHTVYDLRRVVDDMIERHRKPRWAILTGQLSTGEPMMATVQLPLRSARWPRFDTHIALVLPYDSQDNGIPTDESLVALRSFEDRVDPLLHNDGELVAHETAGSRRTLHYYVDSYADVPNRIGQSVSNWPGATVAVDHDPDFAKVRHLA